MFIPHVYTFPNVTAFLRHVKLQQDAGCASDAPNTDEVMEDDSDEELSQRHRTGGGKPSPDFFTFFTIGSSLSFGKFRRDTLTISQTFRVLTLR